MPGQAQAVSPSRHPLLGQAVQIVELVVETLKGVIERPARMRAAKPVGEARQLPPSRLHAALGQAAQIRRCRDQIPARCEHVLGDQLAGDTRRCCPDIGHEVSDQNINLMPHGGHNRQCRLVHGAGQHLLVERPKILQAAAAARHDHQIGAVWMMLRHGGETAYCAGNLLRSALSLDQHGPHDHPAWEAIRKPMEDIANHRARGRGDHADGPREEGQRALAFRSEQAFGSQPRAGFLEQRQQGTLACQLHPLDHDLVLGAPGIGGDLAAGDHLHPVLGPEDEARGGALPHHPVDHGLVVLQAAIEMARSRALHPRQLAANAHEAEPVLHHTLQAARKIAHAERLGIVARPAVR